MPGCGVEALAGVMLTGTVLGDLKGALRALCGTSIGAGGNACRSKPKASEWHVGPSAGAGECLLPGMLTFPA